MTNSSLDNFLKQKRETKKQVAGKFNFSEKHPLLVIVLDKELSKKNEEYLKFLLDGTAHVNLQVVILADTNFEIFNTPHTIVLPYNRGNRNLLIQAADMALCFDFNDVEEMLLNGTIPISMPRGEIADYNPNRENGNSFVFKKENYWSIFATIVRALETFKFPYDWNHIIRQGLETVSFKKN
ncbi:MAG: hypothetical protein AAB373_04410 [Patescibacteria group bacterium]